MARLVEGDLQARWARRRRERMLDELKHHFIICGFGRIGQIVASEFARQDVPFVIIERDTGADAGGDRPGYLAVEADASSEEVLSGSASSALAGSSPRSAPTPRTSSPILTARLLRPDLFIIGRAETEDAKSEAGAGRSGSRDVAVSDRRPAAGANGAAAGGRRFRAAGDQLGQPRSQHGAGADRPVGAPLAGRTIVEANLRQRFGVVVVGIQRANGRMEFNPAPDSVDAGGRLSRRARAGEEPARARSRGGAGRRCTVTHERPRSRRPRDCRGHSRGRAAGRPAFTARPAGRRDSASCWSARIRPRRSTSGTRCGPAPSPGSGSICSACRPTATLDELLGARARG